MNNKDVLDANVSCFKNYADTMNPQVVNLLNWLTCGKYKASVAIIRSCTDKEERDKLKARLPAIIPTGVFIDRSHGAHPAEYSKLICIDIDKKGNEHIANFASLKKELSNIPNVAYCGLSVSGQGFFLLIPIAYPNKHELHFDALVEDFADLGIAVDKSCRNISRLRGYSYDDEAYFNHSAEIYNKLKHPPKPQQYRIKDSSDKVAKLVDKICSSKIDITNDYKDWFAIGCAIACEYGENGRGMFHRVSRQSLKYKSTECDKQYTQCMKAYNGKRYTIGTFIYFCKQYGILLKE